jgi:5-methylcytosine-specific restriction endonuclease McrA
MLNFIYKKAVRVALEYGFINKENALKLCNILKYGKLSCEICKKPITRNGNKRFKMSFDHIIPKSKGGRDNFENLRITHCICNNKRGGK